MCANVIKDNVRTPTAAGALTTGVSLLNGGVQPVAHVHSRECSVVRHKVRMNNLQITMDAASGGAADGRGQKLITLPAGKWLVLAVDADFTVTTPAGASIATAVWALGTALATADNAALTSTEANVLASTTLGDGTLAAGAAESETGVQLGTGTAPALVGGTSATDVYFNIGGTTTHATDVAPEIAIDGTIELVLIDLGGIA